MKTIKELESLHPCNNGLEWAKQQKSLHAAWEICEKSDWMWWILQKLDKTPKELSIRYSRQCVDHATTQKNYRYAEAAACAAIEATTESATYAAYAATYAASHVADERKWQADLLRTLTHNPFEI